MYLWSLLRAGLGHFLSLFWVKHFQVESTVMGHICVDDVAQSALVMPGEGNEEHLSISLME